MAAQDFEPLVFTTRPNPALHRRIQEDRQPIVLNREADQQISNTDTAKVRVHLAQNADPNGDQKFQEQRHALQRQALPTEESIAGNKTSRMPAALIDTSKTDTNKTDSWPIWPLATRYRCYDITAVDTLSQEVSLSNIISYSGEQLFQQKLYLFNVIVALEWQPSRRTLQQLIAAFQNASDFLYDVTNGYMAFGQVVFGGMELMAGADIQILASNRFNPRSWVNALNDPAKYTPIRLGRAIWHKNNHVSIPWNEPEGYRAIVHEWGHYALGLLDEYIQEPSKRQDIRQVRSRPNLVIPKLSISSESIMASLDGTSELVPQQRKQDPAIQAEVVHIRDLYPGVDLSGPANDGPYSFPIELPAFSTTNTEFGAAATGEEVLLDVDDIALKHCWVYLIRWEEGIPCIVAQGSLDARSQRDPETNAPGEGFWLYGLRSDDIRETDTLLFIGNDGVSEKTLRVMSRSLPAGEVGSKRKTTLVHDYAMPNIPIVTVIPESFTNEQLAESGSNTPRLTDIRVRVEGRYQPDDVWISPLGQPCAQKLDMLDTDRETVRASGHFPVSQLDGIVLLRWKADPAAGRPSDQLMLYDYSQGGGPNSNVKAPDPPITAGSSDGNVMFFFRSDIPKSNVSVHKDYSKIRIVTTRNYAGLDASNPGQPRSYLFSAAWNEPIPAEELCPTLVMNFDRDALEADDHQADGTLQIYRYDDGNGWIYTDSYIPKGAFFAAVEMNRTFGAGLERSNIAHYRLFLKLNNA